MNLKFEKVNNKKKKILIGISALLLITITTTLIGTRAAYKKTQSIRIAEGIVDYIPDDLSILALYKNDGNGDVEINSMPDSNYAINSTKSYCLVNGSRDTNVELKTINGNHIFKNVKKRSRCYIYFDKAKTIIDILANKTKVSRAIEDPITTYDSSKIYYDTDNDGLTYYYVGAANDNWVKFADMYWRIIRVNGDGSIRMIYAGTQNPASDASVVSSNGVNSTVANNTQLSGTYVYNSRVNNLTSDNALVGYMYGTIGSSTYEATHANINSSNAKTVLENWYKINIYDKKYDSFVSNNAYFCSDRKLAFISDNNDGVNNNGDGTNQSHTYYISYTRLYFHSPENVTFKCVQANDTLRSKNSKTNAIGSKVLDYPVGLITIYEALYAGVTGAANNSLYLYSGNHYWTMTPDYYYNSEAVLFSISSNGSINNVREDNVLGLRPVINLSGDVMFANSSNGTYNNPYVVVGGNS